MLAFPEGAGRLTQAAPVGPIPRGGLVLVLLCVALGTGALRVATRTVLEPGIGVHGDQAFGTFDPDGHYHMRRLERALATRGAIDGRDPLLTAGELEGVQDSPRGAPIPWPDGFTRILWLGAAPFAPSEPGPARDSFVEVFVGSSALVFGVLQALIAAVAAAMLVGGSAALGAAALAGSLVALAPAALRYSFLGMGDHHALASGLIVLSLLLVDRLLRRTPAVPFFLATIAASFTLALAVSVWLPCLGLAGLAALFFARDVLRCEFQSSEREKRARLALLYFLSLGVFLLPLGWGSPWPAGRLLEPSWMQAILAGCLGFPFLSLAWGARNPWPLRGFLALVLTLLVASGVPAQMQGGLVRGFAWFSGTDAFMGSIGESRPPGWALLNWTGPGLLVALVGLVFPRKPGLLLWRVAFVGALAAGCLQVRFTESLVPLMAVLGGVAFGAVPFVSRRPMLGSLGVALLAISMHGWLPGQTPRWTMSRSHSDAESATLTSHRSIREACLWLRGQPDPGPHLGVLAQWDLGHGIEWLARRRTLATNFGAYLGRDAFLAPWVALTSQDDAALQNLLTEHRVSHVLVNSRWRRNQEPMQRLLGLDEIPARALIVRLVEFSEVPGFLRLVHQSPVELFDRAHARDSQPQPGTRIYEVVPGVTLAFQASPGDRLQVALPLVAADDQRWMHRVRAVAGEDGIAQVLLPYATDGQGAGDVRGEILRWSCPRA